MKFAVFTASSILTISFAQENATFTLYGEGDTRRSPNCATNVNVCGQPNQSGITAALSQAQYALAPGQGTSPDCGTCWKITITSDLSGNPVEEKTAKITVNNFCPMYSNPICNTPNEYDDGIHFDLSTETSAESFLTLGAGIGTERQVSCGVE